MNDKIIFSQSHQATEPETFQSKKEFHHNVEITPDLTALDIETNEPLVGESLTDNFDQAMNPKPRWWIRAIMGAVILFLGATVAQSIQWLIDTWQAKQWIYFGFSIASCSVVIVGVSLIFKEFWRLRRLRQHLNVQEQSAVIFHGNFSPEQSQALCEKIADSLRIDNQHPSVLKWLRQVNDGHSAQEIAYLFSQNVMLNVDKQAKKLVTKAAIESATVVAISPLALVDMFFVAWRNIRLVNRIAKIYGIELGYFSRLRLMKLVLLNIAFTGTAELLHDVGMNWLSQDLTATLSARAAQGIGVGLLTARLGIKTIEFCRPLVFHENEKPRLYHIQKEMLSFFKNTVIHSNKLKETERV